MNTHTHILTHTQDYKGSAGLRAAVARYFSRHALQSRTIDAEDLAISAGCGVCLENLFFALCEDGDACMVCLDLTLSLSLTDSVSISTSLSLSHAH